MEELVVCAEEATQVVVPEEGAGVCFHKAKIELEGGTAGVESEASFGPAMGSAS